MEFKPLLFFFPSLKYGVLGRPIWCTLRPSLRDCFPFCSSITTMRNQQCQVQLLAPWQHLSAAQLWDLGNSFLLQHRQHSHGNSAMPSPSYNTTMVPWQCLLPSEAPVAQLWNHSNASSLLQHNHGTSGAPPSCRRTTRPDDNSSLL